MPAFNLVCTECGEKQTRVLFNKTNLPKLVCIFCSGKVKRVVKGPSLQVKERLDNGIMVRAVERLANAEELFDDRSKNADPLSGGRQRSGG